MFEQIMRRKVSLGLAGLPLSLLVLALIATGAARAAGSAAGLAAGNLDTATPTPAVVATPTPTATATPPGPPLCGPQGWRVVSSHNPAAFSDSLFAVGVVTSTDVWA